MTTAPVALFVYNRADNTRRTLEALLRNTLAAATDLYVFSDGGRDERSWKEVGEVRRLLDEFKAKTEREQTLRSMTIVRRAENIYLERNITEGIAAVMEHHDRIIVLEDDIVTSPYFLQYMNEALTLYADSERVMHVSGFTNLALADRKSDFYFTPHMAGWGWATWRDRWQGHFRHFQSEREGLDSLTVEQRRSIEYDGAFPCLRSLQKQPVPWDICWEIAICRAGGLCLSPSQTLVRNIGLRSGTHFRSFSLLQHYEFDREPLARPIRLELIEPQAEPAVEQMFAEAIRDWGIRYTWLGRTLRRLYLLFRKK